MEGTIAEIRIFSGNFAPRSWMFCKGQLLSIAEYTPLYSLIGTTYGGDGQVTFALPNLASRVPVGTGQGPGLSPYVIGQMAGVEQVTLLSTDLATHNHQATASAGTGTVDATFTVKGSATVAGVASPAGAILGNDPNAPIYKGDSAGTAPLVPMAANSVSVSNLSAHLMAQSGIAGSSTAHENRQPLIAMNYIICVEGIFPSRN